MPPTEVMIDPGHGGRDPGAVNDNGTPTTGDDTPESVVNLEAALTMKHYLAQRRIGVDMTRRSDRYVDLRERTRMAEEAGARLFVSVHHDTPTATRPGVYYNDHPAARPLAEQIAGAMGENAWTRSHTASNHGRLYIADFDGPAVLLELGPTAPVSRGERIHRVSLALVPIMAHLRETRATA